MKALTEVIQLLGFVRLRLRQQWLEADDVTRKELEVDEDRVSKSLHIITEILQADRLRHERWLHRGRR